MGLADQLGPETVVLWVLAALGAYHLFYILRRMSRQMRYRASDLRDASNQLRFVMAADFATRKVMNAAEYRVFKAVEDEVKGRERGWRVFAQTSMGEFLTCDDKRAFGSINSKRVDVLVIGPDGRPRLVVEYQGAGHHQGNAAARDAVKKEALRRASIPCIEISASQEVSDIRDLVNRAIDRDQTTTTRQEWVRPVRST